MLKLGRKPYESVVIRHVNGDAITVTVLMEHGKIKLLFDDPDRIFAIVRSELIAKRSEAIDEDPERENT